MRHTVEGKPATAIQLFVFADHYEQAVRTLPVMFGFCPRCTQPLEDAKCHVCRCHLMSEAELFRAEAHLVIQREKEGKKRP